MVGVGERLVGSFRVGLRCAAAEPKYFGGIGELRIDFGPGYRLYFVKRGNAVIILLCGGDKSSQKRDIKKALNMATEV